MATVDKVILGIETVLMAKIPIYKSSKIIVTILHIIC